MKIALLGGTFNPIHLGHLYLAEELRVTLGYERVVFIPSHSPPHKEVEGSISADVRLDMTRAGLEDTSFEVDDCEIRRGGVSYMIDTVRDLMTRYTITGKPGLLVGDDLVGEMDTWSRWPELRMLVDLVVARRSFDGRPVTDESVIPLDNILLPISSREIRWRVKNNRAYRFLIPEPVYRFIRENNLYRN